MTYTQFPKWFQNKKCGANIKNNDDFDLDYCIANYFNLDKHNAYRPYVFTKWIENNIKRDNLIYPITINQIETYCEINNHLDISIDIYEINDEMNNKKLIYFDKDIKSNHLQLAYYKNHYILIKNIN